MNVAVWKPRREVADGAFTAIPRWSRAPAPGVAEHVEELPDGLVAALWRAADECAAPLAAVILAAHARVLGALCGEPEVVTGLLAAAGARPLPCRLNTGAASWRELVAEAAQRHAELPALGRARVEAGATEPAFETVLDLTGGVGDLAPATVLCVGVGPQAGVLRLRYRTEVVDAAFAARIAGYHRAALALVAAAPDAEHGRQSLLTADELRLQLEGLSGAARALPERRFHELFEARVREHPDAVAAELGAERLSYRELNASANRIARALLARGLGREDVVAVVTERNLDWMAAVLAIFKAGGAYLPVEPHFPPDRIARMLARAGCRLVLTEAGSTATLDEALAIRPEIARLRIEAARREDHEGGDLGVAVAPDQLAYIYFTSGSTGEPKGAMCEHAGFLNHLLAKIDDCGIGAGQAVAQTAPQCFDISLWQLTAALLTGGRTVLVEQEAMLDVARFLDTIALHRVAVLQVVPSYLDAIVSALEQRPRALPDLHTVSTTGEPLGVALARRWFAVEPGVRLVNAYGLTETSDDTNHEVMARAPEGPRVPLGRPVGNVHVTVVDENLAPVPLGAPGEIVFSGVCVGRGYVNDPERTRLAFLADPHRPGQRLYRSGDQGRWRPDGKLEFLGRRDTQVKIRGFRIEISEVENALARVEGVRGAAVVVADAGGRKHLVGFTCGRRISPEILQARLARTLPQYMIPSSFHWRSELPLTANGKTDRKALAALAGGPGAGAADADPPRTPAERRLAAAWGEVLGLAADGIGRTDHFFERGGTSLAAVRLVIALDRAVSLKDVTRHPVLADLARLIGERPDHHGCGPLKDTTVLTTPTATRLDISVETGRPPLLPVAPGTSAQGFIAEHRAALRDAAVAHGSLLVRGLDLGEATAVADAFGRLADGLMTEREGFAPRRRLADGLYASSKWPPKQPMCMHHELSYRLEFPGLMLFACLVAPTRGGATAVADASAMLRSLPADLVARFEREGWLLTRNYNDEIGASLVDAFGTEDRGAIEAYCRANAILFEWQADGGLRTAQRRAAVVRHPVTGERCWFNQIAFLNSWTLAPEVREFLLDGYGEDGLPFETRAGNGDPIDKDVVDAISAAYEANARREPWQAGDLLLVDNIRTAHARDAFEGPREVLVGLADPTRLADGGGR